MGCNTSKLDDEEVVQICKDRKKFIKNALEYRTRFASGHIAYIQSLKRVSAALHDYIEGDQSHDFLLDSYITPPFTPVKKMSPKFITISPKCFSLPPMQSGSHSSVKINYYRPGGNPSVSVEERPQSPETAHIQTYSTVHQYGIDGFFSMQSPQNASIFSNPSPNNRPAIPPPSPQTSQWDFFWNPFSSLDYYGYPAQNSLDQSVIEDEIAGLRQVREEEGIPELEEESEHEEICSRERSYSREVRSNVDLNDPRDEVTMEDVNEDEDEDEDEDDDMESEEESENEVHDMQPCTSKHMEETCKGSCARKVEVHHQETAVGERKTKEEPPGFTVYVNRRPTSMEEVIKDLETQFVIVCDAANEVSTMLEASKARYLSTPSETTAIKMLNPVVLLRSASSRSSSSRNLVTSSNSKGESCKSSSSDISEDSCMFSGSHQSTLDRLYAWEKRLYEEVRSGERIRQAYEKKCMQLRSQDVKGEAPSSVDKTRVAIRDLHTQIKVSIHSIEAISKRIETLRDEELQPQILELVQGLARMWKVMAECHQIQKRTLDEAKLLLAGTTPSKLNKANRHAVTSINDPQRLARSAANLESELRNWRACFESWITSQRSYVHALSSWLLRCMSCEPDPSKLPLSPNRSALAPPIFEICIQWTRFLDVLQEIPVLDGLDFFAAGMGSIYAQQLREDSRRTQHGSKRIAVSLPEESSGTMEVVEFRQDDEETMSPEKMEELAIKVLCAGMSVAVSSLAEFAFGSAKGYVELVNRRENGKLPTSSAKGYVELVNQKENGKLPSSSNTHGD